MNVRIKPGATASVDDDFEVLEANWLSICAFLACNTQWRVGIGPAGMIWIGLDYAACEIALKRRDFPDHVFEDLYVIEHAALPILNSRPDE